MPARITSVNVVHALVPDRRGDLDQTAIDKRPVEVRVPVTAPADGGVGLAGDQIFDSRHHGGPDQAVYAYADDDRAWWAAELGRELAPGSFGQNLDTAGLAVTGAVIGERWQVGDDGLVLEVTSPRIPCATFQGFMDEPHWVKRFTEHGASGAYLRVVAPGTVGARDAVSVVDLPAHGVTVGDVFHLRHTDAGRLRRLLAEQAGLAADLEHAVRRDLAARDR
ncbi:MAG: MOSC domain-containing protein [Sporichthyaceae bacterium]